MKKSQLIRTLIAATFAAALASCHKDKNVPLPTPVTDGLYVLNQGLFNDNNSTLSFYSYTAKQVTSDIFSGINGRGLGDTGNDIEIYGSKMYIVVNVSSTIEVVNAKTGKSIKQIKMVNGTTAREPRNIVFYKNNAYISSYDGTVGVMDTTALTVSNYVNVGRSPEQLAVSNGKLYVANSGGLDYPHYDNTVSVIDIASFTVLKTLTVTLNPQDVVADNYGNVYVLSGGDYNTVKPSLAIISSATDVIKSQANFDAGYMSIQGDNIYFITAEGRIEIYNAKTQAVTSTGFVSDGTAITSPYSVTADGTTGEVFVTDAKDYSSNGEVFVFNKTGKKEYTFVAGINPGRIALLKN